MSFLHTDIPDLRGYDTGLVLSNLAYLQRRYTDMGEATLAELWELAAAIRLDAGGDQDTEDSILLSLQDQPQEESAPEAVPTLPGEDPLAASLDINRGLLSRMACREGLYQRLVLYRFLSDMAHTALPAGKPEGTDMGFRFTGVSPSAKGRVAYMKSAFADKAYLTFSGWVPDCRAQDAHSFVDACEEVFNGLCQFCILPLESTDQGRLIAFSRLVIKYQLYVVAACDMEDPTLSGHRVTRFGLLCRRTTVPADRLALPFPAPVSPARMGSAGSLARLELLHTSSTAPSLSDLLAAAEFCGLNLLRADTLPDAEIPTDSLQEGSELGETVAPTRPIPPPVCLTLDTSSADLDIFSRWLTLEAPDDTVIGFYRLL